MDFHHIDNPEDLNIEIFPGGNTILFQGEVLCLRWVFCQRCEAINFTPVFLNLSKQEREIERITDFFHAESLLCPCGDNMEITFLSQEELETTITRIMREENNSDDFDGD